MRKRSKNNNCGMALVSALLLLAMASVVTLAAVQLTQLTSLEMTTAADRTKERLMTEGALNMLYFCLYQDISGHPARVIDTEAFENTFADPRWQADSVQRNITVNDTEYTAHIIDAGGYYSIDADPFFENFDNTWSGWYTREAWDFTERQKLKDLATVLMDYCDGNDISSLTGAEKDHYKKNNMPAMPRNAPVQLTEELSYIPGAADFFAPGTNADIRYIQPPAPRDMPANAFVPNLYSTPVRWLASLAGLSEEDEELLLEARDLWTKEQKPYAEHLLPETFETLQKIVSPQESGLYLLKINNQLMDAEATVRIPSPAGEHFIEFYDIKVY